MESLVDLSCEILSAVTPGSISWARRGLTLAMLVPSSTLVSRGYAPSQGSTEAGSLKVEHRL